MPGLGTLINVAAIVAGGLLGLLLKSRLSAQLQDNLVRVTALCCMFIAIEGTLEEAMLVVGQSLKTQATLMVLASFLLGTLIGSWLGIESAVVRLGEWLKQKSGSREDQHFTNAFVITSLTVCIGAMAVVGSIRDGISGDVSILAAKSVMDLVFVMAFSASLGKGCIFAALPVGVFQGALTALAVFIEPLLTEQAISNLSLVGSMMIFCVGVNILWGKKFQVADMLPALVVAVLCAYL